MTYRIRVVTYPLLKESEGASVESFITGDLPQGSERSSTRRIPSAVQSWKCLPEPKQVRGNFRRISKVNPDFP